MVLKLKPKGYKEAFAQFFEEPTREGLRAILKENVGELNELDFKEAWPEQSSLAKHILGLANSGGGCIVAGVEDQTLNPKGLEKVEDKTVLINGIKNYVPPSLLNNLEIVNFSYSSAEYPDITGKSFQVLFVDYDKRHLPFISLRNGTSIRSSAIYIRRGTATEEANYAELQQLINARLETGYSSPKEIHLQKHLEQLKVLYQQIDRNLITSYGKNSLIDMSVSVVRAITKNIETVPNPKYPEEDFSEFISRLIRLKKKRLEEELDVQHLC